MSQSYGITKHFILGWLETLNFLTICTSDKVTKVVKHKTRARERSSHSAYFLASVHVAYRCVIGMIVVIVGYIND